MWDRQEVISMIAVEKGSFAGLDFQATEGKGTRARGAGGVLSLLRHCSSSLEDVNHAGMTRLIILTNAHMEKPRNRVSAVRRGDGRRGVCGRNALSMVSRCRHCCTTCIPVYRNPTPVYDSSRRQLSERRKRRAQIIEAETSQSVSLRTASPNASEVALRSLSR